LSFWIRSIPSCVLGPVLRPQWSRHRRFCIAGHLQGVPRLVLAPQRSAFSKSPGMLQSFACWCVTLLGRPVALKERRPKAGADHFLFQPFVNGHARRAVLDFTGCATAP